jgi:glycosyltransferase involved in cell wall biosynthesis
VDRYIALSENSQSILVKGGVPAGKIRVKPNFSNLTVSSGDHVRSGFVSVGRLSPEKGIQTAVRAWVDRELPEPYTLVGAGPLEESLAQASLENPAVRGVGLQPRDAVAKYLTDALALIFPSECYENFPVTLVESFAMGTPVIASRHGAMMEIVEHGKTGLLFTPGDPHDLAEKVRWAASHPIDMAAMGDNAQRVYAEKYTPERNIRQLVSIYRDAMNG